MWGAGVQSLQQGATLTHVLVFLQVRMFTYLIGREAAFADNLKWMACANKGRLPRVLTSE